MSDAANARPGPARSTERRAADRQRSEKSRLNEILLDNMPWPALLLRPRTYETVAANRAALREGAEIGRKCHSAWRRRATPCPWCLAPALWKTGEAQQQVVESDGRSTDVRWIPMDGDLYLHYAIEVTGRHRMEASLRESERLFRNTFEHAQAGIVHVSPQGDYRDANARFCEIVGVDQASLRKLNYRDTTHPEDLEEDLELHRRFMAGEIDSHAREKRYLRKDGSTIWVNRTLGVVRKADGSPDYFVVVAEDITDRKRAEEALRQSRDQLRNLSAHIQDAVEEERKRIAREIHDILGQGLMGLKLDTAWVAENLDGCHAVLGERMADMMGSIDAIIRTVKRIATELRPALLDDLGLGSAIEWQAGDFQKRFGVACRVTIDPRDIELDPARSTALFRIFQEIIENVARHARATKVTARLAKTERSVMLTVRDNGVGIPPGKEDDPLSLGLTGMRERIHPFGGWVRIQAGRRGGTVVKACLPLEEGEFR
jgi:two-component system sensor histidine kinase UhpB